jgi:glycosyltransferase involved in cell wall biosynthesis
MVSVTPILTVQPHRVLGGPSIQHITFIRALQATGQFACHVVVPAEHELRNEYLSAAASLHEVAHMQTLPRIRSTRDVAAGGRAVGREALALFRIARQVRPQLIHTFNEAYPPAPLAARALGVPSVVHVEGMTFLSPPRAAQVYVGLLDRLTDAWICCQSAIQEALAGLKVSRRKLFVAYNSVDIARLRSLAALQRPSPLCTSRLHVGLVAGMDPRKGHLTFIRAAADVCRRLEDVVFHLIGSTKSNDAYLRQIEDEIRTLGVGERVRLEGTVEAIGPWLANIDVYCNTSQSEALSIAMVEAMALGKPVIATDVGGNSEAVVDNLTGLLARPNDPADVASKLVRLLEDANLRASMGRAGARRAELLFSDKQNAARMRTVFEDLLK